ncbi:M24 family metallopeptidase [Undibacterium parvum]|uniref:Aminopeptidase P family protein n=1 Tax=Undibacterium parvum TaxID=401471 RepID=A0A3S9HH27_9BURK|nr:Xaa-Pro peptidase family protein [Undibacterium parvum]AZP11396.1 aminopeptidase P family protein [Undibacterium parvum]
MTPQFEQRLAILRESLSKAGQDALLIFSLDNLRYLLNYSGEAAYGIVTQNALYLITDYRFIEQAQHECVNEQIDCQVICRDRDRQTLGAAINIVLKREQAHRILFESEHISVSMWQAICFDNQEMEFTCAPAMLESQRKIKDEWEVAQIRQAAAISDRALALLLPQLKLGVSEREMALELDYQMQRLGSEGISFTTILGFGARSALPHCIPSARQLQAGDLIVIDFGAVINGYRSDMTRSFVAGKADVRQQAMFDTVYAAQCAALASLHAGLAAHEADAAASAILKASEFAGYAGLGLGHGVGIKLHEQPFMGPHCRDVLQENYVVTIEPGIYIPGYGGIRLEDDVQITQEGYLSLSHAPKQFEVAI